MSNELLKVFIWIFYSIAAIGLIVSIVLFFKLRIIEVIQDLNGTLAQKQIIAMRERAINNNRTNYGEILENGIGDTKTGRTGKGRKSSGSGQLMKENFDAGLMLGSLQNQIGSPNVQNGTTILKSNEAINQEFVLIKNIVYINTAEYI